MVTPNTTQSPFTHNYGKTAIVVPKTVKASAAERTAKATAFVKGGISIPPQSDADRRASFSKAAI